MIAAGALVSRAIGRGDTAGARRIATSVKRPRLRGLRPARSGAAGGARSAAARHRGGGHTLEVAERYLWISLPSNLLLGPGMLATGLLRAVGAARDAMSVTLGGAIVTVFLDPALIFGLGLGCGRRRHRGLRGAAHLRGHRHAGLAAPPPAGTAAATRHLRRPAGGDPHRAARGADEPRAPRWRAPSLPTPSRASGPRPSPGTS